MKLYTFVFYFVVLSTFAYFSAKTETVELKPYYPAQSGEKLLCAVTGKTYCLNVTNYPREKVEVLARSIYNNMLDDDS